MADSKADVLQGTLDLIVLKTLDALGAMHGYGIARRIEQVSEDLLQVNQGTLYPALLRLQQRGWIKSAWGISETTAKRSSIASPIREENSLPLKPKTGSASPG